MKVIKKHHRSFQRIVMEAIIISKTQQQGHNILNSKSGYNRCLIPRLTIVQPDPTEWAPYTDDRGGLPLRAQQEEAQEPAQRLRNNNIINSNIPHPPQKRRKINPKRNISNIDQRVDAIVPKNDTVIVGSDKTGAAKIDEQKHESFPRSSLHSALASLQ